MKADSRFTAQPKEFWAHVRTISQEVGYTERGAKSIKIPGLPAIRAVFDKFGLVMGHIASDEDVLTEFGRLLLEYFSLFGREVLTRLPELVRLWKATTSP